MHVPMFPIPDTTYRPATPPRGDRMFLRGLQAHGYHGVFEDERLAGQRFVVDVDWWIETDAAVHDDGLTSTLCYGQLLDTVVEIVTGRPCMLIETLADSIVTELFARFPDITATTVTVHKPDAPIIANFADLGVSMSRQREDRTGSEQSAIAAMGR
jgi:7,8-dihydroneopterin aldolase/epimerase/oxygenase